MYIVCRAKTEKKKNLLTPVSVSSSSPVAGGTRSKETNTHTPYTPIKPTHPHNLYSYNDIILFIFLTM